jgi:hypothetical protein
MAMDKQFFEAVREKIRWDNIRNRVLLKKTAIMKDYIGKGYSKYTL